MITSTLSPAVSPVLGDAAMFLSSLSGFTSIAVMVLGLCLLITIHELGHWFVARLFGFKTPVFSIGFGPRKWSIVLGKFWDTEFRLAPILAGGTAVVYGSRFLAGRPDAPWLTVAANRTLTLATNLLFGARITDMETCYKIMRTDVARALELESNRFDIEPEFTAKLLLAGHRIQELPVHFTPRRRAEGKKIGWRDGTRALRVLARYRFGGGHPPSSAMADAPRTRSRPGG